jgi:hypothetical protein
MVCEQYRTVPAARLVCMLYMLLCCVRPRARLGARPGRVVFRCVEGYGSWMYPSIDRTLSPRVYGDVSYHTEGEGSTPKVQTKLQVVTYTDGYYYRAGGGGLALVDGWIDIYRVGRARGRETGGRIDRSRSR